jgi:hypothetical protein
MKAVRTVSATEFKQHYLALLEEVRQTRQSVGTLGTRVSRSGDYNFESDPVDRDSKQFPSE